MTGQASVGEVLVVAQVAGAKTFRTRTTGALPTGVVGRAVLAAVIVAIAVCTLDAVGDGEATTVVNPEATANGVDDARGYTVATGVVPGNFVDVAPGVAVRVGTAVANDWVGVAVR